ncbi:F-box/kelch-repeat protein At1g23390-like [Prosopis cineraria]|uniref:F-box/kelch-repeat protein At1g23390-like n=1 Tax=Prosopis cineraria TaxID=364024 RepID=UPI00240F614C|nr:F-box/kelch-repeat protein At1g23390-like [Prosopis cineraria]
MATEPEFHKAEEERDGEAPIHGDILESILSHVPLIDLVPVLQVSKSWNRAVSSSLAHLNPIKPWLMVYTHTSRAPHVINTHAYDPRSRAWVQMREPSAVRPTVASLRSSHSSLLYMLSSTALAFSFDPIHLTWHHADAPRVCRTDPIVALVGHHIVVAGGVCEFEDDPLAVEIYDLRRRTWDTCESMPAILKGSATSTWLSVAVVGHRMHVTEKISGVTHTFHPEKNTWQGPYDLRPDQSVYSIVNGTLRDRVIVAGLVGEAAEVKSVKLWEVRGEWGPESKLRCEEMCEMPKEMVKKVKGEGGLVSSISMSTTGDSVYIYNPSEPEWVMGCEIVNGICKWESVENEAVKDGGRLQRMVVGVGDVRMEDLQKGLKENRSFALKQRNQKVNLVR